MTSIVPGICASFKLERWQGIHDFTSDTLMIALFKDTAILSPDTTVYSSTNECTGSGYSAGGIVLSPASGYPRLNPTAVRDIPAGRMVLIDYDDAVFTSITVDVRAALIYNASKSNRAIGVLDFGVTLSVVGPLEIQWPTPDVDNCIMRSY